MTGTGMTGSGGRAGSEGWVHGWLVDWPAEMAVHSLSTGALAGSGSLHPVRSPHVVVFVVRPGRIERGPGIEGIPQTPGTLLGLLSCGSRVQWPPLNGCLDTGSPRSGLGCTGTFGGRGRQPQASVLKAFLQGLLPPLLHVVLARKPGSPLSLPSSSLPCPHVTMSSAGSQSGPHTSLPVTHAWPEVRESGPGPQPPPLPRGQSALGPPLLHLPGLLWSTVLTLSPAALRRGLCPLLGSAPRSQGHPPFCSQLWWERLPSP